jgi:hypothetical protein
MMLEFYRRLGRGDGWAHRPEILRDIVLEAMRERPGNPHDWAPFVLIGGLVEKAC